MQSKKEPNSRGASRKEGARGLLISRIGIAIKTEKIVLVLAT